MKSIPTRMGPAVALLLTLVVGAPSAQRAIPERDVWYAFLSGEVRYGAQRVHVTRHEDGNFRYHIESRMLLDLFGSQRQEITSSHEYVVTSDLRLVSLKIESTSLSGKVQANGELEGDSFVVVVRRSGAETKTTLPYGTANKLIFNACLEDWLARVDPAIERTTVQVLDEGSWKADSVVATLKKRDASGASWEIETGAGLGKHTYVIDASGILREVVEPRSRIVRCTAAEAKDLSYRNMDGREVLTFPLDKPIVAPDRLKKLVVRLTWKDIPLDEFQLEDARQRVTEKSGESGNRTALVTITAPPKIEDPATLPIRDAALAPYLAETRFIKPKHPGIVAAARKATAGKTDALEAVHALTAWVSGYIEGALIAETLTGPEVLACKKGKCPEYSTLFASLARAVGIPTRLTLGERMVAGSWMGHMWNEAWVGRWVTVDASANEVDESFVLLKFIHSDTVMGTQPLRWKLTESLNLAIESFELTPSALAATYKTGIEGVVYTSVDHACRLVAPATDWTVQDKTGGGATTVRFKVPDSPGVMIHFVAFALPAGTPAKLIIDNRVKMWKGQYDKFEVKKNEPREVAGAPGHTSDLRGLTKRKKPLRNATTELVWVRGQRGYLLNLICLASDHAKHLPSFEKLVGSFQFLGP